MDRTKYVAGGGLLACFFLVVTVVTVVTVGSAQARPNPRCDGYAPSLLGGHEGDTLTGTSYADVISGMGAGDNLYGLSGLDRLCGGRGADSLDGGAGPDRLFGGEGNDEIRAGLGADVVFGGPGTDVCWVDDDDRVDDSCEVIEPNSIGPENLYQPNIVVFGHYPCLEDEVLMGIGDYVDGEWSAWTCATRDDL